MVAITVEPSTDDPCPKARITVTGLLPGDQVASVWRTADGVRAAVRGARTIMVIDSFYVEDYEAPLGRTVTYEVEVVEGADAGVQGISGDVFIASSSGYVQDPLDPSSAVPLRVGPKQSGRAMVTGTFGSLSYDAPISTFIVMGARDPVAVAGTRGAPSGVPFSVLTESEAENTQMRALVQQAPLLLIRGLPSWGSRIPGTATYAAGSVSEVAKLAGDDGPTIWETTGDVVRSSSARHITALWSYQDVADVFGTYDQKQAAAGGGTYLDDQKNPANV